MRSTLSIKAAVFLCVLALAMPAFAQAPASAPAQAASQKKEELPVVRVTTRLVLVSAIVQDKNGNPATDLTKNDFVLLEHGKEQQVSTFAVESLRALPRDAEPLPPNTFSNRIENRSGVPTSITVIFLDGLNTTIQDQSYARQQIVKFLQQLQDRVAIYALGRGEIRIVHDFTSDVSSLLAMLKRDRGRGSPELDAANPPEPTGFDMLDAFLAEASQQASAFFIADRVLRTTAALEALANHLARFPGRKNLIWVSASFPISFGMDAGILSPNRRSFYSETERAAHALSNANVAIYPVDARGLIAGFPGPSISGPATRGRMSTMPSLGDVYSGIDTMQILAEKTGGKAFYNRNDLDGAVRNAMDDARVSYVLGYYPAHGKWDGRFVDLKVKVNRPGLRVRARTGYYAEAEARLDEKRVSSLLKEAAASPLDATSVGITVRVEPAEVAGKKGLKVSVEVETRDITLHHENGRWVGGLDFLFGQRSAEGQTITGISQTVDMHLKDETYQQLVSKKTVSLSHLMELDAQPFQLRVVVRDALSGAVGSVTIPLSKLQPGANVSRRSSPPR
ncbi:MAG: VWA domain-containing protein [Acidobacteria bacterium]|nr:VWA domain-containing protein [Acidobacteriota bacterium]MBI3663188.1 VWA domain-containing protein [Acidobacteriota bacterium]